MKKKYFLTLFFLGISLFGFSQSKSLNCKFDYTIKLVESGKEVSIVDKYAVLSWDFSKLNMTKANVQIEVVPILDCFNGETAREFKESILISSSDKNFKTKNSITLKHIEMMAKCFKYRVRIVSNCEEISDWKYFSYIN
ncbi:hypothetical protein ACFS5J_12460 [Flavobacterium chuncheonense]|uniref:Lipoprotein n=1 Tax=Flavobacterium chuncheonense TaxID=2026653 RepID=A0ABW5YR07_9FLAO